MTRLAVLAGLIFAGLSTPALAAPAAGAGFGEWQASCDNTLVCSAIGGTSYNATPIYLQIDRGAGPGDRPTLMLGTQIGFGDPRPRSVLMRIEGADGAVLYERRLALPADQGSLYRLRLPATGPLLAAIRNGARLRLIGEGVDEGYVVKLDGSSAALRWIDERQRRAGTVTALVARGTAPASSAPPPLAPLIRRAPAVSQAHLPADPPAFVLAATADCEADGRSQAVYRLSPGKLMWLVTCNSVAGYNTGVMMYVTDEAGRRLTLPPIDHGFEDADDEADVTPDQGGSNLEYDPRTRTLRAAFYGRGMRDTGWRVEWTWDGHAFRRSLLASSGDEHATYDWPASYRARIH